jgi:hypothetical protein
MEKKKYQPFAVTTQPNPLLVREWRIANLQKGLAFAEDNGNWEKASYFKKEIEIQKAYLIIEGL